MYVVMSIEEREKEMGGFFFFFFVFFFSCLNFATKKQKKKKKKKKKREFKEPGLFVAGNLSFESAWLPSPPPRPIPSIP